MSADYWVSSQRAHWQFTKDRLFSLRMKIAYWEKQKIDNNQISIRYDTNMRIYIHQMIAKLGRKLMLRQIVLSTAEVYITRFLTRVSIIEVNIYMLVATVVYISCKLCECPQHIRTIVAEARNCWPEFITGDFTKLAEFEFYLIEELECDLIIYYPYNSLTQLVDILGRESNPMNTKVVSQYRLDLTDLEIENAWQIINDSYMTDLPLLYPPHIIAVAALQLVLVMKLDPNSNTVDVENTKLSRKSKSSTTSNNPIPNPNSETLMSFMFDSSSLTGGKPSLGGSPMKSMRRPTNEDTAMFNNNKGGLRRKLNQNLQQSRPSRQVSVSANASVSPEKSNVVNKPSRVDALSNFLAGSNINLEEVIDSVQEMLTLYESWQFYDEAIVRQGIRMFTMAINNTAHN